MKREEMEVKIIRPDEDINSMSEEDVKSSIDNDMSMFVTFKRIAEDPSESEENRRYASGFVSGFCRGDHMHILLMKLRDIENRKAVERRRWE